MSSPEVSIVVPYRNRTGILVENTLRSLRWQDMPADSIEIVISDFGSDADTVHWLGGLVDEFGLRVVRRETNEIWNRSKSLNIGIKAARGKYVLAVDSDVLYAPNFVRECVAAQKAAGDRLFAICGLRDLPETLEPKAWQESDFDSLLLESEYRPRLGTGPCQCATRDFFFEVRGYDEGYRFWGAEDNDMAFRAEKYGLRLRWMHDKTAMLHQWHPTSRHDRPVRKLINDLRLHLTKRIVRKNPLGWG